MREITEHNFAAFADCLGGPALPQAGFAWNIILHETH